MRAFVGIAVSEEVRAALTAVQRDFAPCRAKVKWTEPENIHVTLRFLGEIDEAMTGQVKQAMAQAAGEGPFQFTVTGLGSFPPRGRPAVIWAGVSNGAGRISKVQGRLEQGLRALGFAEDRPFVPHLTIGRVKSPRGAEELIPVISRHSGTEFGVCTGSKMVLFESRLTPRGAVYTVVAEQTL